MINARISMTNAQTGGDNDGQDVGLISIDEYQAKRQKISTNSWALLMLIGYLIVGLFNYSLYEGQSALNSIYLSVITFTTVGYGDIAIENRLFQSFYCLFGAGIVGIYFGMLTNDMMEAQEEVMKEKLVKVAVSINKIAEAQAQKFRDAQLEKYRQLTERIRSTDQSELTAWDRMQWSVSKLFAEKENEAALRNIKKINMQIYEEELRELRSKGLVDVFYLFVSIFSGAACMVAIEGWTFADAFYWACVTASTIGYGDVTPKSVSGKVFTIFYVIFATALAAKGFRDVVCYPMIVRQKESEAYVLSQFTENLSAKTLNKIINNQLFKEVEHLQHDKEQITKAEFILLVLCSMRKVAMKDILLAAKCFDFLDTDREGALSKDVQKKQLELAKERDAQRQWEAERLEAEKKLLEEAAGININVMQSIRRMTMTGEQPPGTRSRGNSVASNTDQATFSPLLYSRRFSRGRAGSGETRNILLEGENEDDEENDEDMEEARKALLYTPGASDTPLSTASRRISYRDVNEIQADIFSTESQKK